MEHTSDSEDDYDEQEPVYPVATQIDRLEFANEDEQEEATESEEVSLLFLIETNQFCCCYHWILSY